MLHAMRHPTGRAPVRGGPYAEEEQDLKPLCRMQIAMTTCGMRADQAGIWQYLSSPWKACLEEAWAACLAGSLPFGAVVAGPEGEILSRGRNRGHERAVGAALAHAELNALLALDYRRHDPRRCVLYATTEPCPLCMGALYMSGVRELRYAARDPYAGSVDMLGATPYLTRKRIRCVGPADAEREGEDGGRAIWGELEIIQIALHVERELEESPELSPPIEEAWARTVPAGLELGKAVFHSGLVRRWREEGASVAVAVDGLAALARAAAAR
jgi:tRNA(adenine34) deaminase